MARKKQIRPAAAPRRDSFPLTDEHCDVLCGVEESAAMCQAVIDRCVRAGYDVSDYAEVNRQQAELAAALKREFFPSRA